jgi:dihydrolipoamide dehydrogenase
MPDLIEVKVPDVGEASDIAVVEVLVAVGDTVAVDDSLITLESDKASMEVPATHGGTVQKILVREGDTVAEGTAIVQLEVSDSAQEATEKTEETEETEETATPPTAAQPSTPEAAVVAPVADEGPADQSFDLVVLGSGPGGYSAAFRAADLGLNVALVERYPTLGGVCLNVGCIPSKALLHAAKLLDEAADFADHGITFSKPKIDLDKLREWKNGVVGRLTGGLAAMAKQREVTVVQGVGELTAPHRLKVTGDDGETVLGFDHLILAAGSRVVQLPFIPDDPRILDSTGALDLEDVPRRLLILGGGIIGLEMATVYHALGSEITVVEMLDQLIPGADKDIVRPLHKRLTERYAALHLKTKVTAVEAQKKGLKVTFDGAETATFDRILVAVGRRPNGDRLGAEAAGVTVDDRGFVPVDRQMRTNVPHIFAIGDLNGQPMLAHKAVHEGKVAAEVAAGEKSAFDARVIPSVAYTDPEIAWVGLTEAQAKAQGIAVERAAVPWGASGRALAMGRDEGRTKLLFDPETKRILGAGIVGPNAGDLIAEVALAIEMDCDAADIGLTVHAHPTLSETVAMAAEAFEGTLTDMYLPQQKKAKKAHQARRAASAKQGD